MQKYRLYLKRRSGGSKHQNQQLLNEPHEGNFREMSLVDAFDTQGFSHSDQLPLQAIPPARSVGVVGNHPNDSFICNTRFGYERHISRNDTIPLNRNVPHGFPSNAIDPMQLAYLQHQQVQNVRKTSLSMPVISPLPYTLLGDDSANINSNMSTIYNNLVPVQFPQPCPVLDYPIATKFTQLPPPANGSPLVNTTTFLPEMLHDEESMDTEVLRSPASGIVSKNGGV